MIYFNEFETLGKLNRSFHPGVHVLRGKWMAFVAFVRCAFFL